MSTAEMLASLEAQIRKDIPRLMELREGLVFQFKDRILKVLYKYDETRWKCVDTFGVQGKFPDEVIKKESKIIGHDIMLNDVLEWLRDFVKEKITFDHMTGNFIDDTDYYYSFSSNYHENAPICKKIWDLYSPYLKDQSEELIKFLYNLKKE